MLIGNKCDMNDKRQVTREKGENVCIAKKLADLLSPLAIGSSCLILRLRFDWKSLKSKRLIILIFIML
jgi:hypothetical protein